MGKGEQGPVELARVGPDLGPELLHEDLGQPGCGHGNAFVEDACLVGGRAREEQQALNPALPTDGGGTSKRVGAGRHVILMSLEGPLQGRREEHGQRVRARRLGQASVLSIPELVSFAEDQFHQGVVEELVRIVR